MNINVNMNSFYLYLGFFCLSIFLDHLIINNYLGSYFKKMYISFRNNSYFYISTLLFIAFLIVFSIYFDLTVLNVS